ITGNATGGVYSVPVTGTRYGISWDCNASGGLLSIQPRSLLVTTAEATHLTLACSPPQPSTSELTGRLSGTVDGECAVATAGLGIAFTGNYAPGDGPYATPATPGNHDLIAWTIPFEMSSCYLPLQFAALRFINMNLTVSADTLADLD